MLVKFLTLTAFAFSCCYLQAGVPFPKNWKKWAKPLTPLTKIGSLPGCKADITPLKLPPIYVETVQTYCPIRPQGPGKVEILVAPAALKAYENRSGLFKDGSQMALHLIDLKLLFVTGFNAEKPSYGVFTEDGKSITKASGPLSAQACITCHTGYKSFCKNGQCGRIIK